MDAKGDAGADPENSERDGRDTCQPYRYFLSFSEFYKKNTKFQRKSGGRGPLGQPLNPPLGVDGCYSSLLFSILARAPFAILFWPVWASWNEGGKSWLIAVLYVAQLTKRRTEEVRSWKWCNDETSPLRRLEEKVITKEKFHDSKKGQWWPKENSTMKRTNDTTWRHGTYATKTADNNLKNNFRSEEVFAGAWKVSIDFVHDLTSYHVLARLPAAVRQMSPRSDGRERRKSSLDTCGRRLSSKGRGKEQ